MASVASNDGSNDQELQNINNDIAQILLKYLQNYWHDLLALSLSCKQWHTRINLFVDKKLRYLAPNTQVHSIAHRNKVYEELSSIMQNVCGIRMFELNEAPPGQYTPVGLYSVPWDSNLIILLYEGLFMALNTRDGSIIYSEHGCRYGREGAIALRVGQPITFNEHRRTMAVQTFDADDRIIIRLYSVNEKQIQLIDTLTTSLTSDRAYTLYLNDDGSVWSVLFHTVRFTTDVNAPKFEHICAIRSNETKDGTLIYYCLDDQSTIKCYDTATRQSRTYLTHPRLVPGDLGEYPLITFYPGYEIVRIGDHDNALFLVVDGKIKFFMAAEGLDYMELSPDRKKFFYVALRRDLLTIYSINTNAEEYIQTMSEEQFYDFANSRKNEQLCREEAVISVLDKYGNKKLKSAFHHFGWLDDNEIFAIGDDSFVTVDINKPEGDLRGIGLPLKLGLRKHRVVDERSAVLFAENKPSNSSVMFKVVRK